MNLSFPLTRIVKAIVFGALFLVQYQTFSQTHITTNRRLNCSWDTEINTWKVDSKDTLSTLIEIDKAFSTLTHTTPKATFIYNIQSRIRDEKDGNDQDIYTIVSDMGRTYTLVLDYKYENIRFMKTDGSRMIQFGIKAISID